MSTAALANPLALGIVPARWGAAQGLSTHLPHCRHPHSSQPLPSGRPCARIFGLKLDRSRVILVGDPQCCGRQRWHHPVPHPSLPSPRFPAAPTSPPSERGPKTRGARKPHRSDQPRDSSGPPCLSDALGRLEEAGNGRAILQRQ